MSSGRNNVVTPTIEVELAQPQNDPMPRIVETPQSLGASFLGAEFEQYHMSRRCSSSSRGSDGSILDSECKKSSRKHYVCLAHKAFFETTSLLAVSHWHRSKRLLVKSLWLLLILIGLGLFIFQTVLFTKKLRAYPKNTITRLVTSKAAFPAVTICNLNPIPKSSLQSNPELTKLMSAYNYVTQRRDRELLKTQVLHQGALMGEVPSDDIRKRTKRLIGICLPIVGSLNCNAITPAQYTLTNFYESLIKTCCGECQNTAGCKYYTYHSDTKTCYLGSASASVTPEQRWSCSSGSVSTDDEPTDVTVLDAATTQISTSLDVQLSSTSYTMSSTDTSTRTASTTSSSRVITTTNSALTSEVNSGLCIPQVGLLNCINFTTIQATLTNYYEDSIKTCCAECSRTPGCKYYTYRSDTKTCFLGLESISITTEMRGSCSSGYLLTVPTMPYLSVTQPSVSVLRTVEELLTIGASPAVEPLSIGPLPTEVPITTLGQTFPLSNQLPTIAADLNVTVGPIPSVVTLPTDETMTIVDAVPTIAASPGIEALLTTEPLLKIGSVPTIGPLTEIESLATIEPLPGVNTLNTIEPSFEIDSLDTIDPLSEIESLVSIEPFSEIKALTTIEPLSELESLASIEPLSEIGLLDTVKPLSEIESLVSIEPLFETGSLDTVEPLSEIDSLASIGPLAVEEALSTANDLVPTLGPLPAVTIPPTMSELPTLMTVPTIKDSLQPTQSLTIPGSKTLPAIKTSLPLLQLPTEEALTLKNPGLTINLDDILTGGPSSSIPGPAILTSISNMTSIDVSIEELSPRETVFYDELAESLGIGKKDEPSNALTLESKTNEAMLGTIAEMDLSEIEALSPTIEEALSACTMNGKECDMAEDFKTIKDPSYGTCHTFHHQTDPKYFVARTGSKYGLKMQYYVDIDEYLFTTTRAGIRITVHPPDSHPFPEAMGYFAPVGSAISLGLSYGKMERLPDPYGNCTNEKPDTFLYDGNYSKEGCFRSCFQQKLSEKCKCADSRFPAPEGVPFCNKNSNPDGYLEAHSPIGPNFIDECLQEYLIEEKENSEQDDCRCYDACKEEIFKAKISRAAWPGINKQFKRCTPEFLAEKDMSCSEIYRKNAVYIEIYKDTFLKEESVEEPAYDTEAFANDIVNSVGLWLSVTVVSTAELLIYGTSLLFSFLTGRPFPDTEDGSAENSAYSVIDLDGFRPYYSNNSPYSSIVSTSCVYVSISINIGSHYSISV